MAGCPVDHEKTAPPDSEKLGGCPVDHSNWNGGEGMPALEGIPSSLSDEREVSTIPRANGQGNWVYPSQQQFYSAMVRKNQDPNAKDMKVVIPIHNAVNERAWAQILRWEKPWMGSCQPKLLKFIGDSKKLTPKARWGMLWGNAAPFDRHDWVVDRCGVRVEYVIDFYGGQPDPAHPERPSFYLDARPKLNSWEGIKMRLWEML